LNADYRKFKVSVNGRIVCNATENARSYLRVKGVAVLVGFVCAAAGESGRRDDLPLRFRFADKLRRPIIGIIVPARSGLI
jgi:hypothetical protein